ncbi:MAG: 3-methyl-2-oxobutanoate hydroxymethyltransferase, partial [Verrucomicrobiota bacterium]|nr:3-methyl-2-oxobutanoate hydroxymethyltransferase [Verrucomicrobiota bacterium]
MKKITVKDIINLWKEKSPIAVLTAYDVPTATIASQAEIDIILVGDSLGMTTLGYETTLPVTIEEMLHHTKAVVRGSRNSMVVADMPFMTYQITPESAMKNATRFLQEAGAQAVKLEGGVQMAQTIKRLTSSGIPVMGHIGLLPQSFNLEGKYRKYGKVKDEKTQLIEDAKALAEAGAFSIVLEGVETNLAAEITELLSIPTIGIASGSHCSGQVQVISDIFGLSDFTPKHARVYIEGKKLFTEA